MKYLFLGFVAFMTARSSAQAAAGPDALISAGEFTRAEKIIDARLKAGGLSVTEELDLRFKKEKMDRIRKDFTGTPSSVLEYIGKYYPGIKERDLEKWEKAGTLEHMLIDGKKWYFSRAAQNLFRLDPEAKKRKDAADGGAKDVLEAFIEAYAPKALEEASRTGKPLVTPVTFKLDFTLTVAPDAVPDGETVRCWLPYPREGHARQTALNLVRTDPERHIAAGNDRLQRSLYMEKPARKGLPTVFNAVFEVTNYGETREIRPDSVPAYDRNSELFRTYTAERPPHIVFTDRIKELSAKIVGGEKNPYLAARKIFAWVSANIPWAGAREYSTIDNISEYGLSGLHGDCGIQTLVFMTLARYNGIPAKWQSGWMLHPGKVNLHDWGEIYLEGYGWVPMDQSFGLLKSGKDDRERYFYLGGLDPYHLIVNDDFSVPLYPAKIYPRSETVDFQRGEVEWRGGNLYFDKWDYDMKVEYAEVK